MTGICSYEAHSNKYRDYHILSPSLDLPILEAVSLPPSR